MVGTGWRDGYLCGQVDVLTWLRGDHLAVDEDGYTDHPLAPISEQAQRDFALWCLAHNLFVAALLGWVAYARAIGFTESWTCTFAKPADLPAAES